MPSSPPSRSVRRASSPYPLTASFHRHARPRFLAPHDTPDREQPSFLGSQGQPIEIDNPFSVTVSAFRPLTSLPTFHNFDPSPLRPIPVRPDLAEPEAAPAHPYVEFEPRELASPVYRDSPPSYHRDDSPVFRPQSQLFRPSPPPLMGIPGAADQTPVISRFCPARRVSIADILSFRFCESTSLRFQLCGWIPPPPRITDWTSKLAHSS